MKKSALYSVFIFQFLFFNCFSQNLEIDSLLILIKTDKPDTNKVNHLNNLSREYINIGLYDTALHYGNIALKLAQQLNLKKGLANSLNNIGIVYYYQADYPKTLEFWSKALKIDEESKDKNGIAKRLGNIGMVCLNQSDYLKALDYYLKALKLYEELNDKKGIATNLSNIGNVYHSQGDYPKALDFHFKALKFDDELKNKIGIARHFGNIGLVYKDEGDYPKALEYYFKALKIHEELGDKNAIATGFGNIGIIYAEQHFYPQALDYYFKALKIYEEIGNKNGIAIQLGNIGGVFNFQGKDPKALDYYFRALKIAEELGDKGGIARHLSNIGSLYTKTGKFKDADQYLKRALVLAHSIGTLDGLRRGEELLSQLYDTTRRYKEALIHYKKAIALKDAIFSQENIRELASEGMNFDFEKKVIAEKAEQDKKDAIAQAETKKQNIIIWSVVFGLLLVVVFTGIIFRSLRITRKQRDTIELQKSEVLQQKEIVEKQKQLVEEKQKEIVDSITYAKRIQRALLTSDEYIKNNLPGEHFILFKPKDIVSGDFYWAHKSSELAELNSESSALRIPESQLFYIATADCTGHGVPGAFMSMLNISYLNESVIEKGIRLPQDLLNEQRVKIIKALNPKGSTKESKDGMDCVLCAYNFDKMLLHFSAANNPLWLLRNAQLIEYKADKMPVGKYTQEIKSFTLQTIELQKGDVIYTSTDGFADQFGTNGKKLMKKKLKEELLKIHQQPMNEQKEYLDNFFESWKGSAEQVDDVCVIGIRI